MNKKSDEDILQTTADLLIGINEYMKLVSVNLPLQIKKKIANKVNEIEERLQDD